MIVTADDNLTSLNWLLTRGDGFLPLNPPTPPSSPPAAPPPPPPPPRPPPRAHRRPPQPRHLRAHSAAELDGGGIDYVVQPVKPPYSYAQLITMAMQSYGNRKVVLLDIYKWIRDNFAYFRDGDNSWQNSIRHNLSLNKQFVKVPRDADDRGKGSYWMLDKDTHYSKDPYCLRRRNFIETHTKRQRPTVSYPQINPAVKTFLEKTRRLQECRAHPFAGMGERVEDVGAQECVYTDAPARYEDFNQKLFKQEVETYAGYVPQNDLLIERPGQQKVKVEYNWEGYEYRPSGVGGVQLPICVKAVGAELGSPPLVGTVGLSPASEEGDAGASLDLRIPTPEWWGNQVTTASLLSPTGGSHYPLARVFETMSSTAGVSMAPISLLREHPWQERSVEAAAGDSDGLFNLEPMTAARRLDNDAPITVV